MTQTAYDLRSLVPFIIQSYLIHERRVIVTIVITLLIICAIVRLKNFVNLGKYPVIKHAIFFFDFHDE